MITCKPKSAAFYALIIFLIILGTVVFGILRYMSISGFQWWAIILLVAISLLMVGMLLRLMFTYKTLKLDTKKQTLTIRYPLRFGMKEVVKMRSEILYWKREDKKIGDVSMHEVEIFTKTGIPIKVNDKAHSNINKLGHYLYSNYKTLERKSQEN
ncbi:hypothetical protein [Algivirga pacifica]|uniref:DUF304 domain-containing protein n=1 Tax=Algivirga pacifica TaxID=1162670 RepID=A0ABP9DLK8_9BACT